MEDGVNQEQNQSMSDLVLKDKGKESQIQSELRSELPEEETLQESTQVTATSQVQVSSLKSSDNSQSKEFIENLFHNQLREEADARVSP